MPRLKLNGGGANMILKLMKRRRRGEVYIYIIICTKKDSMIQDRIILEGRRKCGKKKLVACVYRWFARHRFNYRLIQASFVPHPE